MGDFLEDFGNAAPEVSTPQNPNPPVGDQQSFLQQFGGGAQQSAPVTPTAPPQAPPPDNTPAPSLSEIPGQALSNLPHSAAEFAGNMIQPIIHPIDTAKSIGNIGQGALEKAGILSGDDHVKYADAVGRMVMERYGSLDNFKKTLAHDPVGVAGDLSMILTGGESALGRLPGIAGKAAETAGMVGRAIDPVNAATTIAKPLVKYPALLANKVGTEAIGLMTGTGGKPIEEAMKAGFEGGDTSNAFTQNMRGNVPVEQVVEDASDALSKMRKDRGADYRANMARLGLDNTVLDFGKLDDAFREVGAIKVFKGQDLSPTTAALRDKLDGVINDWYALPASQYHTPEGFDALKQKIGDIRDATEPHTPERVVADKYYQATKRTIVDQVPEYAKMMNGYAEASDIIKQIERTLSVPSDSRTGPSVDTSLRKLQSVLRNNVSTNFGYRTRLIEYLQNNAPHLMASLAGQSMNSLAPRGLARLAAAFGLESESMAKSAKIAATLPFASPRIVGEVAHGLGRVASPAKYVPKVLNRPVRNTLFQVGRATQPYTGPNLGPIQPHASGGAVERALSIAKGKR